MKNENALIGQFCKIPNSTKDHKIEFWSILLGVIAMAGVVLTVTIASWVFNLFLESLKILI